MITHPSMGEAGGNSSYHDAYPLLTWRVLSTWIGWVDQRIYLDFDRPYVEKEKKIGPLGVASLRCQRFS